MIAMFDLDRTRASKNTRKHRDTLLGEGKRPVGAPSVFA
jgi:hypothetical protein